MSVMVLSPMWLHIATGSEYRSDYGRVQATPMDRSTMTEPHRSGCPINLTLELLGDRWSLIVIRDIIFGNRRYFRELLTKSEEGIASNILADPLKRFVENGLLTRTDDPDH